MVASLYSKCNGYEIVDEVVDLVPTAATSATNLKVRFEFGMTRIGF
jgi:hypothetical protein